MKVKEEKLREWDRVIAEAKAWKPQESTIQTPTQTRKPEKRKFHHKPNMHHFYPVPVGDGLDTLIDYRLKQQSYQLQSNPEYVEEAFDPELFTRQPKKQLHLERQEESMARLVDRLLDESKLFSDNPLPAPVEIQQEMVQMRALIQSLMDGNTNLPLYEWNDIHEITDQREALSRSIQALCRKATADDRPSINLMLTKVSYNLLVARAPPCTTNLNVFLAELIRLKQPQLSQIVVNHFVHDTKHKPTKVTAKLMLDHYRFKGKKGKGDAWGYRSIVQRMRGCRKSAEFRSRPDMLVKHRDRETLHWPEHEEWVTKTKTIHRNGSMHQKLPRDAPIFDSLILGNLKFLGPQGAVRVIRASFRAGHVVHHESLVVVITACLEQLNFSSGLQLIRVFIRLWWDGVGFIATVYTEQLRHLLRQLLLMCGIDITLKSPYDLPIKHSWDALQDMLHFMEVEDIKDAVERISELTFSLSQSLGLIAPDATVEPAIQNENTSLCGMIEPGLQQEVQSQGSPDIDQALQLFEDFAAEVLDREFLRTEIDSTSRWRRLLTLEDRVDRRCWQTTLIEDELLSIMSPELSVERKEIFDTLLKELRSWMGVRLNFFGKLHVLQNLPDVKTKKKWKMRKKKAKMEVEGITVSTTALPWADSMTQ
ncbi:uncharacterized protein L3040_000209 [Drepanopeziza brunnea f. sp. 'multigermtubi']|uniref:Uncharacterized protein n=1 Tax=Marssonina brunnea f. sp. multigermtubi (strain MB_m1) TaxID=1072389 RepID=K1WP31_MARBU|nr:uncharacterized protein MBM_07407 [Drepanopeziza brunnea f. sp. 'multigermtubi' MB_m1]EKD14686.1 hypothetical protein MBM_07407 [Drepanopeziza brunnea f. sp. 'multigermtubi' MB_m1]KAJ5053919.1 hypothetical protein L3040_000209 [Drepanopeziza brunnea f. sp. 'multigermtubi']